jgi:hypothetical protein
MKTSFRLMLSFLILSTLAISRANADCVVRWNSSPGTATGVACQSNETLMNGGCSASAPVAGSRVAIIASYPAPTNWNQNGSAWNGTWQCAASPDYGSNTIAAYALCCH